MFSVQVVVTALVGVRIVRMTVMTGVNNACDDGVMSEMVGCRW